MIGHQAVSRQRRSAPCEILQRQLQIDGPVFAARKDVPLAVPTLRHMMWYPRRRNPRKPSHAYNLPEQRPVCPRFYDTVFTATVEDVPTVSDPFPAPASSAWAATHFYIGDHLGTAQMEFASGGWPVWRGQFTPFGQELDTQATANNYRFTGLEYDSDAEVDHAMYRQYSPVSTRWLSADPYNGSMNLNNPQSFNRYSYVLNNPLVLRDPSGLECTGSDTFTVYADGSADDTGLVASCSFWDSVEAIAGAIGTGFADLGHDIKGLFVHHASLKASRVPRPSAYDPDSARISALAQGINQGAGALNNPSTYVEWYGASAAIAGGYLAAPAVASWGANASGLLGPATGRVFWSAVGAPTAAAWAAANGGETLEMSPLGGFANWAQGYLPQNALTGAAWNALSSAFASGAQGGVTYLQGAWLGNTWLNTELPILLQNGNPISTVPNP